MGKNSTEQANTAFVFMRLRLCLPFVYGCVRLCSCVKDTLVYVFRSRSNFWICLSFGWSFVGKLATLRGCFACVLVSACVCVCVCVGGREGGFV